MKDLTDANKVETIKGIVGGYMYEAAGGSSLTYTVTKSEAALT